jgi:hypothetical protein
MFAVPQNHSRKSHTILVHHGIANDCEGLGADLLRGSDIIGLVEVAIIDLRSRHEAVDFNRVGALQLHGLELLIDLHITTFAHLVAASFLILIQYLSGLLIDHLFANPISGFLVDDVEMGLLGK